MTQNIWFRLLLVCGVLLTVAGSVAAQGPDPQGELGARAALGTAFTYQGQLKQNGDPVNETCDFRFTLYDAAAGGSQVGSVVTRSGVPVSAGLFTVGLDFGTGAFTGDARWLEIAVRCPAGSGGYTSLSPRQALTAAPYALALPGLWTQPNASSPNLIGGYNGNSITGGAVGASIGGGGASTFENRVTDDYGAVGGGLGNWAGDAAGTVDDASYAMVGGGQGNVASGFGATIGGGSNNEASDFEATVSGGFFNAASAFRATVAGGAVNEASGQFATVAGGASNTAGGDNAAVGGGANNLADGNRATVSGGSVNQASNEAATVSGGVANSASGQFAAVPGGRNNSAAGNFSFAAGRRAKANHAGTFVWADSKDYDFSTFADNGFKVRATGGVRIVLAIDETAPGPETVVTWNCTVSDGTTWSCSSSRNLKENLTPVDGREILERLRNVPIHRWNGKGQDPAVTHIGPTSEDFYAAFGLGQDDGTIATVDLDGVALAAIQGLHQLVQEQETQITAQQQQIAALEARLEALEQAIGVDSTAAQPLTSGLPGAPIFFGGLLAVALVLAQRWRAGSRS